MDDRLEQARKLLIEWVDEHRRGCAKDCGEVGNVLACLAHSMGASQHDLRIFPRLVAKYDIECQGFSSPSDGGVK